MLDDIRFGGDILVGPTIQDGPNSFIEMEKGLPYTIVDVAEPDDIRHYGDIKVLPHIIMDLEDRKIGAKEEADDVRFFGNIQI
jgi:hypothetical protein